VFAGIAMFVFKCGSRNALDNCQQEELFRRNYQRAFGLRLPDMDTVTLVFRDLAEDQLKGFKKLLVNRLIKRKVLDKFRLNGMLLVAIDGTGLVSFDKRHCDTCLTKTSKTGVVTYFHHVLEAKIVTANGFSLSLATEWIENPEGHFNKQDCELKAFYRMAEMIKKEYPRLPICICLDSLYPNQNFFDICVTNQWGYITVLKLDRLKNLWKKISRLQHKTGKRTIQQDKKTVTQRYWFSNEIKHNGHVHSFIEIDEETLMPDGKTTVVQRFVFLTNQNITHENALNIAQSGRLRWKIEKQGFDQQKNHGYNISHKYCRKSLTGLKNFYQCCQIGHLLNQLVELSVSFRAMLTKKMSIKHLWTCMLAQLLCIEIPDQIIHEASLTRYRSQFVE
jgi:hypothetical protein